MRALEVDADAVDELAAGREMLGPQPCFTLAAGERVCRSHDFVGQWWGAATSLHAKQGEMMWRCGGENATPRLSDTSMPISLSMLSRRGWLFAHRTCLLSFLMPLPAGGFIGGGGGDGVLIVFISSEMRFEVDLGGVG